jgi:hypothetical protein
MATTTSKTDYELMLEFAANYFGITMATMHNIEKGVYKPKLFIYYFEDKRECYLWITHPSKSGLFYKKPGNPIEFHKSQHVKS